MDTGDQRDQDVVIDIRKITAWLWKSRRGILLLVCGGAILGGGASFLVSPRFTAKATLIPQLPVQQSGLIGRLASLTSMGADLEGTNEALYGIILNSDRILDGALAQKWTTGDPEVEINLYSLLGFNLDGSSVGAETSLMAKREMRKRVVSFNRDPATGFMSLRVTLPRHPDVAADLANYLVGELDKYNRIVRTQKAREHRSFIETNLIQIEEELSAAENILTEFLMKNKVYKSSPKLLQDYNIIEREVQAQRAIWLQLRTQLESAKVDEHREKTSIHILDRAVAPVRRSYPNRFIFAFWGMLFGFVIFVVMQNLRKDGRTAVSR